MFEATMGSNRSARYVIFGIAIGIVGTLLLTDRRLPRIPTVLNIQHPLSGPGLRKGKALFPFSKDVQDPLFDKVRILVWVMTMPKNLETKATAVKETWGKHSNVLMFFSSYKNEHFPTVGLEVADGREHLTAKTMAGFRYIYDHHFNDADWFMKADDDTFVILENLRHFLRNKNSSQAIHFGHLFHPNVKQGYYSGGGGYVLSKEALRRFGTKAVHSDICNEDGYDEDGDLGLCMEALGVKTSNSVDDEGKTLFHPLSPEDHFLGEEKKKKSWIWNYSAVQSWGRQISKRPISFHYVTPEKMRMMDYFLYYTQVGEKDLVKKKESV